VQKYFKTRTFDQVLLSLLYHILMARERRGWSQNCGEMGGGSELRRRRRRRRRKYPEGCEKLYSTTVAPVRCNTQARDAARATPFVIVNAAQPLLDQAGYLSAVACEKQLRVHQQRRSFVNCVEKSGLWGRHLRRRPLAGHWRISGLPTFLEIREENVCPRFNRL
jgi:hypothetical protein